MNMEFVFMENGRFGEYAPVLYDILSANMSAVVPGVMDYEAWRNAVGDGMQRPQRRIVLIMDSETVAGFFQYYVNNDVFMMEEIQLRGDYRHTRQLFRRLYAFLMPHIPDDITAVEAYTDPRNARSAAILEHIGLARLGDEGGFVKYRGDMSVLRSWLGDTRAIYSDRLMLRPVELSDVESTFAYAGDAESVGLMMFLPYESMEETEQSIRDALEQWQSPQPERREYAVIRGGEHIGGITLYHLDAPGEAELGWVLRRDKWGRGYATEAARALMAHAKREWGVRRVIACCDSENIASKRVMEKLGMRHVSTGTRKNRSSAEERTELVYELFI